MNPSQGSMLGGTLLTIYGNYFDQTDAPAMVLVGGNNWLSYSYFLCSSETNTYADLYAGCLLLLRSGVYCTECNR